MIHEHMHSCACAKFGGEEKVNSETLNLFHSKFSKILIPHFIHWPSSVRINPVSEEIYMKMSKKDPHNVGIKPIGFS